MLHAAGRAHISTKTNQKRVESVCRMCFAKAAASLSLMERLPPRPKCCRPRLSEMALCQTSMVEKLRLQLIWVHIDDLPQTSAMAFNLRGHSRVLVGNGLQLSEMHSCPPAILSQVKEPETEDYFVVGGKFSHLPRQPHPSLHARQTSLIDVLGRMAWSTQSPGFIPH